jgi:murein DD-endopeptidase MepM/ murein hydrolase activator NlpD
MDQRLTSGCLTLLSLSLLGWSACGTETASDTAAPESTPPEPPPREDPEPPPSVVHEVAEGQTLWDIARAYDVTVAEIMDANGLEPSDVRRLSKGRSLTIPGATAAVEVATAADRAAAEAALRESLPELEDGAYHFLGEGETIWDLARTYEKSIDEIMTVNEFTDDDVRGFRPGRPIVIPGIEASQVRASAPREERERSGIRHEVSRGETVWDLANAFQVSVSEIMAANGMDEARITAIREGESIFIPGVDADVSTGRVRRRETTTQRAARPIARRLGLGTRAAASKLLVGRPEARWVRAAGGHAERLPGTLRWPVARGRFVRGYGSGEGGYHLAVDIAGNIGWNVRAAAPGIVGYSGNEVTGYGNMVLLVHPGGWVTMYAHNSTNFVAAGERVPRGGILAEVGSTGISRGPHVHFELMHGGKNCDPAHLFRPGIRHGGGRLSPIERVEWTRATRRPRQVSCDRRRRHPRSRLVIDE